MLQTYINTEKSTLYDRLYVCRLEEQTRTYFKQWFSAKILPLTTIVVTQRRNSLLCVHTDYGVRCGPVAFSRDYTVIVETLTDRTSFIPYKVHFVVRNVTASSSSTETIFDSTAY